MDQVISFEEASKVTGLSEDTLKKLVELGILISDDEGIRVESLRSLQSSGIKPEIEKVEDSEKSIASLGSLVDSEILDAGKNSKLIIPILIQRISSLTGEKKSLQEEVTFLRDRVKNLESLLSSQIEVISQLSGKPRFPVLSRILQALGLENPNRLDNKNC